MTDWNAVSAFMANVVAWPGLNDPGYVNLHYSRPDMGPQAKPGDLIKGGGWPFRDIDEFIKRAAWINTVPAKFKDVWFCTSTQGKTAVSRRGKAKAVRSRLDTIHQKSIWVDVDVGPPEEGKKPKYPTVEEALKAILLFQVTVGLPPPSAIVYSGGGIHVYWISKTPLKPEEWAPYASGLKQLLLANNVLCDTGLTTDLIRILRVPGTLNFKYDPPKPVTLAPLPMVTYDFAAKLMFLQQFAAPIVAPTAQKPVVSLFVDGVTRETFGAPNPLFDALKGEPGLDAGIDKAGDKLLDPFPIFRNCGFLRHALTTGGKDYDQTLWMYSLLCSTFMENGNDIAHRISQGHPSYTKDDTQALYDRKVAERADRGIGYPACATIQGAGCKSCASCPLLKDGKSPLNIRPAPKITATVSGVQSAQAQASALPASFDVNDDGIICKMIEFEEEGEVTTTMVPLFQAQLSDFWLQKHPGEHINFTITVDKGFTEQVSVDLGEVSTQGFPSYLGKRRVLIDVRGEKHLKEFFLSIIGKLRALAAAQQSVPFGWYHENGARRGFVFDGRVMLDDGTERPCGSIDPNTARKYLPKGSMEEWMKGANVVFNRQRPELSAIALVAFAAPLMAFTDHNSVMISAVGSDSGAGKSSAAKIGLSVWGDPLLTKGTESQTVNNITHIMKTIRNLPFYWDEITGEAEQEKVCKVMMEADGGKEKGRMLDGTRAQVEGTWQMMLCHTANGSLKEYLRKRNKNTSAQLMRCLEWEVKKIDGGAGLMQTADADALLGLTRTNHGLMGAVYGKYLALHHERIAQEVLSKCKEVELLLKAKTDERIWTTGIAVMSLAAGYARDCGINVDPTEIETFMYQVYQHNLLDRDDFAQGGKVDNSESTMTRYLKDRAAAERGIWTNYMHNKQGKPPKPVVILKGPTQARNTQGGIEFRFACENHQLILAQEDFDAWLEEKKNSTTFIHAALKNTYAMKKQRLQMCSGTVHDSGREECLVLHITPGTPLWGYMMTYTPPEDKEATEAGTEPEPVETGLTSPEDVQAFVEGAVRAG